MRVCIYSPRGSPNDDLREVTGTRPTSLISVARKRRRRSSQHSDETQSSGIRHHTCWVWCCSCGLEAAVSLRAVEIG